LETDNIEEYENHFRRHIEGDSFEDDIKEFPRFKNKKNSEKYII
jgi:hypothetical protein